MENSLKTVGERDLHYHRQRQRNRVFSRLVAFVVAEAERRGFSKKDLALALNRDPSQITRWLSQPTNLTLDTISDILTALEAEMDVTIVRFNDRLQPNFSHPLLSKIVMPELGKTEQIINRSTYADPTAVEARFRASRTGASEVTSHYEMVDALY